MLDPNQTVTGKGILRLRRAGIEVDLFPPDQMAEIEDLNRDFSRDQQEIVALLDKLQIERNGLISVSTGRGRDDDFQAIRARAKHKIIVVGIGMSQISMYARRTLNEQAKLVPIDFMMIDPDFLNSNPAVTCQLQEFLDIRDFSATVRASYTSLEILAKETNSDGNYLQRMQLRVYRTIPTMSMVMIDPDTPNGELIVEFFLYHSGEHRPRFHVRKTNVPEDLFSRIHNDFLHQWSSARRVVES
jgi:hypothetical protein